MRRFVVLVSTRRITGHTLAGSIDEVLWVYLVGVLLGMLGVGGRVALDGKDEFIN